MSESTAAAILCGGKSSRMGFDKSLLQFNGRYHIQTIYNALSSRFNQINLVTNQPTKFDSIISLSSAVKIKDHYPGRGPIGGMCTAIESIEADWVFICACDLSYIDVQLIDLLNKNKEGYQVVILRTNNYLETLFAFYHKSCLHEFKNQLQNGRGRPADAFSCLKVNEIELHKLNNSTEIFNLNTKEDLKVWKNSNYFKE